MIYTGDHEWRNAEYTAWIPKDGLRLEKGSGDQFLKVVMPNAEAYDGPVDDPLFSAHRAVKESSLTQDNGTTVYLPDHPIKAVTCTQHVSNTPFQV